jgi:hypothetical protein
MLRTTGRTLLFSARHFATIAMSAEEQAIAAKLQQGLTGVKSILVQDTSGTHRGCSALAGRRGLQAKMH